jgi:uroporphyrinogen-III synthase
MPSRALAGLRILVTRPEGEGADAWAAALEQAGAVALRFPTVAIAPPDSWDELDLALAELGSYDWLILTSQTAVTAVAGRLPDQRFPPDLRAHIAVVGPATAALVAAHGGRAHLVPEDHRQEGLAEALGDLHAGCRVLFPLARGGRTLLSERLRKQGCHVHVVTAYQTSPREGLPSPPEFDVATFASPSAFRGFIAGPGQDALMGKLIAVIGTTTAKEVAQHGLCPVVAEKPDAASLVSAITQARNSQGVPNVLP